jgi:formimidoylglutamate deiminase
MAIYRLHSAYLPQGWARDVLVTVSAQGVITAIAASAAAQPGLIPAEAVEHVDGIVIPGMPNAHSHAFQRAMAGDAEFRAAARDSFWTWRQAMYTLANRIGPEDLQIVATQLFIEMLKSGYTSVAEFHYLHRLGGSAPFAAGNPLWDAIDGAAAEAGIGLTFLPTLYQSSDFGSVPLKSEQSRFAMETDAFLLAVEARIAADRAAERRGGVHTRRTGAAFHSLRAVPLEQVRKGANALRDLDSSMPVHIHVAEQSLEVVACRRAAAPSNCSWTKASSRRAGA